MLTFYNLNYLDGNNDGESSVNEMPKNFVDDRE